MANLTNLTPWKKGQSGNPKGKDRKYVTLLKDQGYKKGEINDTIQIMMSMTLSELKQVFDNPEATILETTIANSMKKDLSKAKYWYEKAAEKDHLKAKQALRELNFMN